MRIVVSLILVWGFLLSAGCQPNLDDVEAPPETPPNAVAEPTSTSEPVSPPQGDPQMTPSLPTPAGLQSLIDKAIADLAQRLGISVNEIVLVEATSVTWPNASLGCPQKGMVYADVLTPGYLIILNAKENEYEYHASTGTEVIYCINPSPPVPGTPGDI